MTQKQSLKMVNDKIDKLIIIGKTKTIEYKNLIKTHKILRSQ